jgi:DNA polymerase
LGVESIVTVDIETYYDKDYSLRKMATSEYVRDERFLVHMLGIQIDDKPVDVWVGKQILQINDIDWSKTALLCHNNYFDGFVLSERFKVIPKLYLDTLSMSRGHFGIIGRHDLDSVAERCGVQGKVAKDSLAEMKGLRVLPSDLLMKAAVYCAGDTVACRAMFDYMLPHIPPRELRIIDLTVRMFTEAKVYVDEALVQTEYELQVSKKAKAVAATFVTREDLTSNEQFASALRGLGVEPPMKRSKPTSTHPTGRDIYAFAKNDLKFQALQTHPDEKVRNLVAARLAVKSTIGETRAVRLLNAGRGHQKLPILLHYCGAHTTRWSAGNKMNMQNLPKLKKDDTGAVVSTDNLRRSIIAPDGFVIGVVDSAQIEARVNAHVSGHTEKVELFRQGKDLYSIFASKLYGYEVSKSNPATKDERQVGKVCELGLGFGMGPDTYQDTMAKGMMGPKMDLPKEMCVRHVDFWRQENKPIVDMWSRAEQIAMDLHRGISGSWKYIRWYRKDNVGYVEGPTGMRLVYPFMHCTYRWNGEVDRITYNHTSVQVKTWGGSLTENIVQFLARCVVADQLLDINERYPVIWMSHDEVVFLMPEKEADEGLIWAIKIMSTPPAWAPDLPLAAEGDYDRCYSK